MDNNEHKYDKIINLPHYRSKTRKHMSVIDRAAQFAPFSALTGYDSAVKETARLTEERIEPDEYSKLILNGKLQCIQEYIDDGFSVSFTYFKPDEKKIGGMYVTVCGVVKEIKEFEQLVVLEDDTQIPMTEIICIESDLFDYMGD